MKKGIALFLRIVAIYLLIDAALALVLSVTYQEEAPEVKQLSDVNIFELTDYEVVYFDKLEILERYAFQTMDEYSDSEGGYTDIKFFVYPGSHAMDDNELTAEYYVVKFYDQEGTAYVASMTVSASDGSSISLDGGSQTISACVGIGKMSHGSDTDDRELEQLREDALDAYAEKAQAEPVDRSLGYQSDSIDQYKAAWEEDVASTKLIAGIAGVVLTGIGVSLLVYVRKKTKVR